MVVEHDERGDERVAGEALFTGSATELAIVQNAGFTVVREQDLASFDGTMARLRVPREYSLDRALEVLHTLAPDAIVTANNIYRSSEVSVRPGMRDLAPASPADFSGVLGIIDTGVDPNALGSQAILTQLSFVGGAPVANEHGLMVASLAVDRGMRVHIADVFGASTDGAPAASADSIAAALDWMIAHGVAVINVSIEGPNNPLLERIVQRAAARGHVIVAAAGNGGPLARPAFPAAFVGSVAVTAIDGNDRPYMRANRGAYISFAAPGVDVEVDTERDRFVVSGTSFAAPLVAARIARRLNRPSPTQARRVLSELQADAIDLGAPGRDPIFGWGALHD